jgi:hypothetical protein
MFESLASGFVFRRSASLNMTGQWPVELGIWHFQTNARQYIQSA